MGSERRGRPQGNDYLLVDNELGPGERFRLLVEKNILMREAFLIGHNPKAIRENIRFPIEIIGERERACPT